MLRSSSGGLGYLYLYAFFFFLFHSLLVLLHGWLGLVLHSVFFFGVAFRGVYFLGDSLVGSLDLESPGVLYVIDAWIHVRELRGAACQ